MDKSIRELLEEELKADIESLDSLSPDTEEYKKIVENIVKLHELLDTEYEHDLKEESQRRELLRADEELELRHETEDDRQTQCKKDRRIQYIRIGLEASGIVLPLIFYGVWLKKGFEFEKDGIVTSSFFKNMINRIKPTK